MSAIAKELLGVALAFTLLRGVAAALRNLVARPREDRAWKKHPNRRAPDGAKLGLISFPALEKCHPDPVPRNP